MAIKFDGRTFESPDDLYLAGFDAGRKSATSWPQSCYLVMNGNTPVSVHESRDNAEAHASKCDPSGYVLMVLFHKGDA